METSYLKTLELDKIIARAAEGCVCKEARAMLLAIEPQCDPDEVRYALEQTDAINTLLIKNGSPRFGGVEGVSQLAARAVKGGVLSMGELLMVAGALRNFQHLTSWYGSSEHDALPTDDLFYALAPEPGLEQQISSAILAPDAMADTASRTLAELRKKIRATENSIRDRLESMVRNMDTSKYLQESVVSMRNGRYVVPVKSEYRGEVSGIIHDVSSTGATVFVEPQAVVEANARILQYRAQEAQEIERCLVAFTAQVAAIEPQFQYSYKAMLEIDILLAKARLALELKAFKPAVRTDSSFNLIRARHPLIDPQKCVPVDIALGGEYDSLIITGPNTGGKTVTLKTAGLLCAMAQCGFLIPADERSEICVFDEFLVDIGDEQSIAQNLSTFSSHMVNIIDIMGKADKDSLVLIDELGAGTDPIEGAALAVSVIEYLRQKGAHIAATTHYAELKAYALDTPGVSNGCCEFDVETLRPTYRLLIGVPGRSNAFAITEHLGMEPAVVRAAKEIVGSENRQFESVLENLENARKALDEERAAATKERQEAERLAAKAREEKSKIDTLRDRELDKAKREAQRLIDAAKRTSSDFLLQLEQLKKEQTATNATELARKTRREIKNRLGELDDIVNPNRLNTDWDADYKLPRPLQVGDHVLIKGIGEGDVLELGSKILVSSGMLKTRVKPTDLRLLPPKKKAPITGQRTLRRTTSRADADVKTELDLRGQTVEEALGNLGLFIDKCVLNNISEVRIIHGKGTGALRTAVQEELRHHPNVAEYRLGVYGEGENGVTIAKLK